MHSQQRRLLVLWLGASSFSSMVILVHFLLLPVTSDLKAKIFARLLSQKLPQQVESHWEKLLPGIFSLLLPSAPIICLYGKESSVCTTFLDRKGENYRLVLRTAVSVPVLLSVSTLTTCARNSPSAGTLRWAGSSLGWGCRAPRGSPGSVADGPMIPLAPKRRWLSRCSSVWP